MKVESDTDDLVPVFMPALIVVFAVGAYGIGSFLRGSDVIVNEVAIVRGAPGATEGTAQAYIGVFSPSRGTYVSLEAWKSSAPARSEPDSNSTSTGPRSVVRPFAAWRFSITRRPHASGDASAIGPGICPEIGK